MNLNIVDEEQGRSYIGEGGAQKSGQEFFLSYSSYIFVIYVPLNPNSNIRISLNLSKV